MNETLTTRRQRLAGLLPIAVLLAGVAPATRAATDGEAFDDSVRFETIVVTAEKRDEDLQDVSIALSPFTAQQRELLGIETVQDMTLFTPGMTFASSLDRIAVRGVGRLTNTLGSDAGVANYVDYFYVTSTTEANKSTLFNERVEILRGPQGTLYGRNSIGGAINIVATRPTPTFTSELRSRLGDYGLTNVEGSISGPITDSLRYRVVAGSYTQDEGYFENVAAGGKDEGGVIDNQDYEIQLEADLTQDVEWWVKWSRRVWDEDRRTSSSAAPYDTTTLIPATGLPYPNALFGYTETNPGVADMRKFRANYTTEATLEDNDTVVSHLTWHLPNFDVKYVAGYQDYLFTLSIDLDGSDRDSYTLPGLATISADRRRDYIEDKKFWSNEINLASTHGGPVQWIVGLYQYEEHFKQPIRFYDPGQAQLETPLLYSQLPGIVPAAPNPHRDYVSIFGDLEATSYAAYAQMDFALGYSWNLVTGLRYTRDEKSGDEVFRTLVFDPVNGIALDVSPTATSSGVPARHLENEWDDWSGTLALEWTPDTSSLYYAKYGRGYKSGGINLGTFAADPFVEAEYLNSYELGVKRSFGDVFQANLATFYYDYADMQSPVDVVVGGAATSTEFVNVEQASTVGFEMETIWAPTDELRLMFNYAYLDAQIDELCCIVDPLDPQALDPDANPVGALVGSAPRGQDLEGNQLPLSARHKLAANLLYRWDFGFGSLYASGTYAWREDAYSTLFTREYTKIPAFDQVDFRLTWEDVQQRYTIIAYVHNALDEDGFETTASTATAAGVVPTYTPTPPRNFGVEVQYRFY